MLDREDGAAGGMLFLNDEAFFLNLPELVVLGVVFKDSLIFAMLIPDMCSSGSLITKIINKVKTSQKPQKAQKQFDDQRYSIHK